VTGGGHLDGFHLLLSERLREAGVPGDCIYTGRANTVVPGYFRPTKKWDLVVVDRGRLYGVVELKSQVGSLGNNVNNRCEEAIGSAIDFDCAHRAGAYGAYHRPWLGYLFLMAPAAEAILPRRTATTHFPVLDGHPNASYGERMGNLCARMEHEDLYDATCPMLTSPDVFDEVPNYLEMQAALTAERFVRRMVDGIATRLEDGL
jgi:hypothetical protein